MDLGLEIQKTNVRVKINILEIPCVPFFRENKQLWILRPKFGKSARLSSIYYGSYNVEGVAES